MTDFEIIGQISEIETIAVGSRIRELSRLRRVYGPGRWRKVKGVALIKLRNGTVRNGIKLSRNLLLQQGVPQYVTWLPHQGELLWAPLANAWFRAPAASGIDD